VSALSFALIQRLLYVLLQCFFDADKMVIVPDAVMSLAMQSFQYVINNNNVIRRD